MFWGCPVGQEQSFFYPKQFPLRCPYIFGDILQNILWDIPHIRDIPCFKMKNENEKQKQTSVKDVRTLSSEESDEPRAIGNLDRPYWGWDQRRAPRTFSLKRVRKTQNSIKQQNKDNEWWMNDWPKEKRPNSRLFYRAIRCTIKVLLL